jgi:hypothetical protein
MPDDFSVGCAIPLAQAFAAGLLAGLIVAGAGLWFDWPNPWFIAGSVSGCVSFWWFISSIHLWRVDKYNVPYFAPEPMQEVTPQITPITIHMDKQISMVDLPASPEQLKDLSTGLLAGMSFSEASWSGEGRIFSRDEFRKLRDVWLQKGWCAWANPKSKNQGISLTRQGAAVCRTLAKTE